jgi:hypothetical protein
MNQDTFEKWSVRLLWPAVIALAVSLAFVVHYTIGLVDAGTVMTQQVMANRAAILAPSDSVTWRWAVSDGELLQKEFHPKTNETDREFAERVIVNVKEWKTITSSTPSPPTVK